MPSPLDTKKARVDTLLEQLLLSVQVETIRNLDLMRSLVGKTEFKKARATLLETIQGLQVKIAHLETVSDRLDELDRLKDALTLRRNERN